MKANWRILVIDDEAVMRESLAAWLREDGYEVDTAASGREGIEKARETDYAIYFVDLKMPGGIDGIETMMEVKKLRPDASIVIITAYATVDTAITAMKEGALEYIVKPCNPQEISLLVTRIIKVRKLQRENEILRRRLSGRWHFHDLISKSPRMQEVFGLVKDVASLRSTVLITGESGTGKELVARALHFSGDRADGPFVGVSCAALAEALLESELFGHEKGSFTGATDKQVGKFELADRGTIFLDEVGDMSMKTQAKVLRVLQEGEVERLGSSRTLKVDVRVIAATNKDLELEIEKGQFREDLFFRLSVIPVFVPPLRERADDIPSLVRHFAEQFTRENNFHAKRFTPEALASLQRGRWKGNVRELRNTIERVIIMTPGEVVNVSDLPESVRAETPAAPAPEERADRPNTLREFKENAERAFLIQKLRENDWNISKTAETIGTPRSNLYKKLEQYNIRQGVDS